MSGLSGIHHVALICSDIEQSKDFYVRILGFEIQAEVYREARQSWKIDLALQGTYCIELFSFPNPPARVSQPEAAGLRHLAFRVRDWDAWLQHLERMEQHYEPVRIDPYTGKRFTFCSDPDGLPIEFYEA